MWLLLSIVIVIVLLLVVMLFAPIVLCLDTDRQQYYVRWLNIARAELVPSPEAWLLRFRIIFWTFSFDLLRPETWPNSSEKKKEKPRHGGRKKRKSRFRLRRIPRRIWRMLQSFHWQENRIDIDTDDVIQNAYLYPLLAMMRTPHRDWQINYEGRVAIVLRAQNRLFRLLRAFLLL